jgi:hypothetical protein
VPDATRDDAAPPRLRAAECVSICTFVLVNASVFFTSLTGSLLKKPSVRRRVKRMATFVLTDSIQPWQSVAASVLVLLYQQLRQYLYFCAMPRSTPSLGSQPTAGNAQTVPWNSGGCKQGIHELPSAHPPRHTPCRSYARMA